MTLLGMCRFATVNSNTRELPTTADVSVVLVCFAALITVFRNSEVPHAEYRMYC